MEKISYNDFIDNILKTRGRFNISKNDYYERHHIIPKCKGGTNDKNNLIDLYANEHLLAHKLLSEENPTDKQLFHAYYAMATLRNPITEKGREGLLTPEEYRKIRELYIQSCSQKCAKVDENENIIEIYSSYHQAARMNNIPENRASTIGDVCKGGDSCINHLYFRDLDANNNIISKPIKNYKGKKKIIGIDINNPTYNIYFDSVSDAARILNINRQSVGKCLQGQLRYSIVNGYIFRVLDKNNTIIEPALSSTQIIQDYNNKNPIINGERHSIKEWCDIYNITRATYYNRLKRGYDLITALTMAKIKPGRKVV